MRRIASTLGVFLASSGIAFAAVLLVAWPAETWADDPASAAEAQGELPEGATKVGRLVASARLVQDEQTKSKWYVEVTVKNTTREGPETSELETCVEKNVFNPMARGMPAGTVVWKDRQTFTVPAGETLVVRRPLPRALAAQVLQATTNASRQNANSNAMPRPVTSYSTFVTNPSREQG